MDVSGHAPEIGLILDQALRVENKSGAATDSGKCSGHVCASPALPARRASEGSAFGTLAGTSGWYPSLYNRQNP